MGVTDWFRDPELRTPQNQADRSFFINLVSRGYKNRLDPCSGPYTISNLFVISISVTGIRSSFFFRRIEREKGTFGTTNGFHL